MWGDFIEVIFLLHTSPKERNFLKKNFSTIILPFPPKEENINPENINPFQVHVQQSHWLLEISNLHIICEYFFFNLGKWEGGGWEYIWANPKP